MFEGMTFEEILQRMLDSLPSDLDKREGSVIYDALAPAAVEMQNLYITLDAVLNEAFVDTASLPYLIRKCAERGLAQNPATYATLKAVVAPSDVEIAIGSRFSLGTLNYIVTEKITNGEYKVQCETPGAIGNTQFGDLIPIEYIDGLQNIGITELLIPGEDEEDVDSLRGRYFNSISSQAFGGNIADYRERVKMIEGVGGVKITPTWNGGGTVKVTFTDSTFAIPSAELISIVQEEIDPVQNQGKGYGVAPIGHVVTVEAVEGVTINISTNITYAEGWSWDASAPYIKKAIEDYFLELSEGWDETNDTSLIVRISRIESDILKCDGVIDIADTTLNGTASNMYLTKYQIPVRGSVNGE